jgi:nucleotide-binding universal stress UspA family protein
MLADVVPSDPSVACERCLAIGDPAEAIADLAKSEDAEMIVMATHGRTGLLRMLMGNVAEEVVRKAKCPVLKVKAAVSAAKAMG